MSATGSTFDPALLGAITVLDKDLSSPPSNAGLPNGSTYIVAAGGSGAWAGRSGDLAIFDAAASKWDFLTPMPGRTAYVADEQALYIWAGAAGWVSTPIASATLTALAALTGGPNKLPYFTAAGAAALADLTAPGRALIASASQIAARQVIGDHKLVASAVADDAIATLPFGGTISGGVALIYTNGGAGAALYHFRASSGPVCFLMAQGGAVPWAASTAALSGTTGADGAITVAPDTAGNLIIENRSGTARSVWAMISQLSRD